MRRFTMAVIAAATVLLFVPIAAQDQPHYFTPYGFRLPVLAKGEYILSAYGGYFKTSTESKNFDESVDAAEYDITDYYFSFRSALALTDKLLFQSKFVYYPKRDLRYYKYPVYGGGDSLYYRSSTGTARGELNPSATLVFRPITTLEFFFDVSLSSRTIINEYDPSVEDRAEKQSKRTSRTFSFGLTYLGKL